jgi:hypothetical protein
VGSSLAYTLDYCLARLPARHATTLRVSAIHIPVVMESELSQPNPRFYNEDFVMLSGFGRPIPCNHSLPTCTTLVLCSILLGALYKGAEMNLTIYLVSFQFLAHNVFLLRSTALFFQQPLCTMFNKALVWQSASPRLHPVSFCIQSSIQLLHIAQTLSWLQVILFPPTGRAFHILQWKYWLKICLIFHLFFID